MNRVFNFSAGPAALPESVLEQAQAEMLDYRGRGLSVMEMSHRSKEFIEIAESAEEDLRGLLGIDDDYCVLFLQGGASLQFAMVPLNLAGPDDTVDYVNTGSWSTKAIAEAQRLAHVNVAASSETNRFMSIPERSTWALTRNARYVHITSNETIGGVEFHEAPDTGSVPLVADMSSDFLARPIEVNRFGLIYAGAQKNVGPAGLAVVIVRRDLIGKARPGIPSMLDYSIHADNGSMYNTPPTYTWYLAGLVFKWLIAEGGLLAVGERNRRKAEKLYRAIDASNFYFAPVNVADRSIMNVPFTLADDGIDSAFLAAAEEHGLVNLKGHRSVGGMRASIYNAVTEEAVDELIEFMARFEAEHSD